MFLWRLRFAIIKLIIYFELLADRDASRCWHTLLTAFHLTFKAMIRIVKFVSQNSNPLSKDWEHHFGIKDPTMCTLVHRAIANTILQPLGNYLNIKKMCIQLAQGCYIKWNEASRSRLEPVTPGLRDRRHHHYAIVVIMTVYSGYQFIIAEYQKLRQYQILF